MSADTSAETTPGPSRMRAADRKQVILAAARRAFSATGDVRGTTIKHIAEEAGISEGIIYRHFDSKEDLFLQAAVEPLTAAIHQSTEMMAMFDIDQAGKELEDLSATFWQNTIDTLADMVPLLGLVLFGDPRYAVPFYRDVLAPAIDEMRVAWEETYLRETGDEFPFPLSAMANFGIALIFAIEQRMAADPPSTRSIGEALVTMEATRMNPMISVALRRRATAPKATDAGA